MASWEFRSPLIPSLPQRSHTHTLPAQHFGTSHTTTHTHTLHGSGKSHKHTHCPHTCTLSTLATGYTYEERCLQRRDCTVVLSAVYTKLLHLTH